MLDMFDYQRIINMLLTRTMQRTRFCFVICQSSRYSVPSRLRPTPPPVRDKFQHSLNQEGFDRCSWATALVRNTYRLHSWKETLAYLVSHTEQIACKCNASSN